MSEASIFTVQLVCYCLCGSQNRDSICNPNADPNLPSEKVAQFLKPSDNHWKWGKKLHLFSITGLNIHMSWVGRHQPAPLLCEHACLPLAPLPPVCQSQLREECSAKQRGHSSDKGDERSSALISFYSGEEREHGDLTQEQDCRCLNRSQPREQLSPAPCAVLCIRSVLTCLSKTCSRRKARTAWFRGWDLFSSPLQHSSAEKEPSQNPHQTSHNSKGESTVSKSNWKEICGTS